MSDNENIKKAEEEFNYLTGDEEIRRLAYLREKAIRDEAAAIADATEEGLAKGLEQGRAEGHAEGKAEGRAEGETLKAIEIAKNLLSQNIAIDIIIKATGLTEDEIKKLQ